MLQRMRQINKVDTTVVERQAFMVEIDDDIGITQRREVNTDCSRHLLYSASNIKNKHFFHLYSLATSAPHQRCPHFVVFDDFITITISDDFSMVQPNNSLAKPANKFH